MQLTKYASIAILASAVGSAWAVPITPAFTTFGTLAGATFGGSGIPNDAVAITTIGTAGAEPGVKLGLTAHQRYSNPPLTNNGAGVFRALPGVDTHSPSPTPPYALWNFAYYVGGADISNYTYSLLFDFDPGIGTDETSHGAITNPGFTSLFQDSSNLGMGFLTLLSNPDPSVAFDPNASGEYTFALTAYDRAGVMAGRSAISVLVGDVPEPGSLALVGIALLGLAGIRRRKA